MEEIELALIRNLESQRHAQVYEIHQQCTASP